MATRLYLQRSAPAVSPTPQGAWDDTAVVTRGILSRQKDVNTSLFISRSESNASATWDVILGQWISGALDTAQTISGTFDLVIGALESAATNDMHLHVHLWVRTSAGAVRGTLLTDVIDPTEMPTTWQGVQIPQQTLSAVNAEVNDRIVLEVGYQAQNTHTTPVTGRVDHGGNNATDLTASDTDTSHPAWCEFGTTITDAETRVNWQEKWYPGGSGQSATATPPLVRGAWTLASSLTLRSARIATPGVASGTIGLSMGGTDINRTRGMMQIVSPPLNAGAVPAGTLRITGLALESDADLDGVWALHAYLMAVNGDVRATLVNLAADPDTDNEFPITTAAGRASDLFAVTGATITQDDRLVVEIGAKQLATSAANRIVTLRAGGTGADAQVGDTDTTKPTWLQFVSSAPPVVPVVFVATPAGRGGFSALGVVRIGDRFWRGSVAVSVAALEYSWAVSQLGRLSCVLSADAANRLPFADLKGKWIFTRHPLLGPWGGRIVDRQVSASSGTVRLAALSPAWHFHGRPLPLTYRQQVASAGGLILRGIKESTVPGRANPITDVAADETGGMFANDGRGEDLLATIFRLQRESRQEWTDGVYDDGILWFRWRLTIGRDLRGSVRLAEGYQLADYDGPETIERLVNRRTGVADDARFARSRTITARDQASIDAYGEIADVQRYSGLTQAAGLEPAVRADVATLAQPVRAPTLVLPDRHPILGEIRVGDRFRLDSGSAGLHAAFRGMLISVASDQGTVSISGDVEDL